MAPAASRDIYEEAAQAAAPAGRDAKMYVNEYNVFNWGDAYANWYREHIERSQNADGDPYERAQSAASASSTTAARAAGPCNPCACSRRCKTSACSACRMSLTEFGVQMPITDPASRQTA